MKKQTYILAALAVVIVVLAGGILLLLSGDAPETDGGEAIASDVWYLVERDLMEVAYVAVNNEHGFYDITQMSGGFSLHDIPAELINADYLMLALEEAGSVAVREKLESGAELAAFGLDQPRSSVEITYTDGETLKLEFGAEEPITNSVYMRVAGDEAVYLAPRSHTVRFLMPVENYIQFVITPERKMASAIEVVKEARFYGKDLPEEIYIRQVDENSEEEMREASAFGVATHLVREPVLHEIDQGVVGEIFQSMLGLISEGIIGYNMSWEEIAFYGFDDPDLAVDYTIKNGKEADEEIISLKVARQPDGSLYAVCGDNMVVYRILDVAFTKITYENAVMRWFLTPMTIDISGVSVSVPESHMEFTLTGETNKDMKAYLDGEEVDISRFRAFYQLLTSACHDGQGRTAEQPKGEPLLTVEYHFKDPLKESDVMKLYRGPARKVLVEVNGICEFTMSEAYLQRVLQAEVDLKAGNPIETDW